MSSESDSDFEISEAPTTRSKRSASSDNEGITPKFNKKRKRKMPSKNKGNCEALKPHNNKKLKPTCNIVNYIRDQEMSFSYPKYKKPFKDVIMTYCRLLKIYRMESPFDRRVTFMVWHPTNPRLLAVASHWGDVIIYDYEKPITVSPNIQGIGPGGSIQGMKFHPLNQNQIFASSMEGKFMIMNFETKKTKSFIQTNDINRWYISVDVNLSNNTVVAGDTKGGVSILTVDGEVVLDRIQLHKKTAKVSHAEFSKKQPWLLCTSSTDSTMKLWDIRSLRSDKTEIKPLQTIKHEKAINAAYFSLKDGSRLLTTDQNDKIYIYRAPLWDLETCIMHPHRQFQHLTPIKAYWHPFEDIVFIGRYPHNKFPGYHDGELRTIDFFDADSGELLYQHYQAGCNGILSLNRFNITGEVLASSYGARFLIWKPDLKSLQDAYFKTDDSHKNSTKEAKDLDYPDETDWGAVLKNQTKEKSATRKKLKIKTMVQVRDENREDEVE